MKVLNQYPQLFELRTAVVNGGFFVRGRSASCGVTLSFVGGLVSDARTARPVRSDEPEIRHATNRPYMILAQVAPQN